MARKQRGASTVASPSKQRGRNYGGATKTNTRGSQGRAKVIGNFNVPTTRLAGGGSTLSQADVYRNDRASAFGPVEGRTNNRS